MLTLSKISKKNLSTWSNNKKNIDAIIAIAITIKVPCIVSLLVGQVTLKASCFTSWINFSGFLIINIICFGRSGGNRTPNLRFWRPALYQLSYTPKGVYSKIFVTTPAPTVLPPSRIAKFNFSLIAIGVINLTVNLASSPGITISVPAGSSTSPVTSVVLK